ncbi:MAG: aminotransferase [Dethiosulfovibrio peptidovorans]|nr:MAG: aminotransferase [Dethiosulfovibrio peptidovorans]
MLKTSESLFTGKIRRLEPSMITKMQALGNRWNALSFTAGQPSSDLYPLEGLQASFARSLGNADLLPYSPYNGGYPKLRQWIVQWMRDDGLVPDWVTEDQVMLIEGAQEGIHLAAEAFIELGDGIVVESPTYTEALCTFRRQGASIFQVAMDDEGIIPHDLERVLSVAGQVKFLYTVVNFQNPSGCTTTDTRKKEILALVRRYGTIILEDDPYRHLRYEGEHQGSYMALAGNGMDVIYLGSFSKIIAPGLRVGWMVTPPKMIQPLVDLQASSNSSLPAVNQYAVWDFMSNQDVNAYLEPLKNVYRERRDALAQALRDECAPLGLEFVTPNGGFFLWGQIPWLDDDLRFARYVVEHEQVALLPGSVFFADPSQGLGTLRFSFAQSSPENSKEGTQRLARAMKAYRDSIK